MLKQVLAVLVLAGVIEGASIEKAKIGITGVSVESDQEESHIPCDNENIWGCRTRAR